MRVLVWTVSHQSTRGDYKWSKSLQLEKACSPAKNNLCQSLMLFLRQALTLEQFIRK